MRLLSSSLVDKPVAVGTRCHAACRCFCFFFAVPSQSFESVLVSGDGVGFQADGFAGAGGGSGGDGAGFFGTLAEDVFDVVGVGFELGAAFAHGGEVVPEGFEDLLFEVAVSAAAFFESVLHFGDLVR